MDTATFFNGESQDSVATVSRFNDDTKQISIADPSLRKLDEAQMTQAAAGQLLLEAASTDTATKVSNCKVKQIIEVTHTLAQIISMTVTFSVYRMDGA